MQVWTHELDTHLVQTEDRAQLEKIEQQILHEYNEIKAEIEDNELRYNLTFTRPFSSYLIPKDPGHLGRERRLYLERLAHVRTVPDVVLLCDEFQNELNTCTSMNSDYTPESLPLLLQAFYLKRLSSLTYAKTLHSIRWKRFCRQQIQFIQVEQQFNERSARILAEFNDALQRSQRLSTIRETLLGPPPVVSSKNINQPLINDDYVAYVRYLVCQYRGQRYMDQLSELIRILHLKFRTRHSSDTQTLTINLQSPISPYQTTTALYHIPTIELDQKQTLEKLNILFHYYSLPLDTSKIHTSGDEMELYANIIRHYRIIFFEQEKRRPNILYESAKPKIIAQSRQSSNCQLIKKSSWINFITIKPECDSQRERDYWKYIKGGKNDELLMRIVEFLHVRNADKVANILKQYLLAIKVKKSTALKQILENSTTNTTQATAVTDIFWKNIFDINSTNGTNQGDDQDDDNNDNDELPDTHDFRDTSNRSAHYMKRDEFNYLETLQKLGLDDTIGQDRNSDTENNDASESYGLQLSYITLRLLRVRTLRDRCLHEFNYFRSIQRTLTIYEQRLIMTSKGKEFHSIDQRFSHYIPHTYLFDTPHECTFDILNYMQSGEHIDNIEDYAHEDIIDNDGSIVYVQDSSGLHIIYDCAFDDINELEQEIISIGSYFIEKSCLKNEKDNDYQRKIDRFEILYNLWEYELNYLQYKRKIIDCFYEVYQHTFDHDERHIISQIIINIMSRRPRIDFRNDDYFSHSYSLEIHLLKQYLSLIREYINRHIIDIRQITENLFDSNDYGSYFSSLRSQSSPPIYLSVSKIHSYYLFEFIESLSSLTRLPYLLKQSLNEFIEFEQLQHQINLSLTDKILYEIEYFDEILLIYKQLEQPGGMYALNQQRDIFNTLYSDHPTMMGKFAYEILKQIDESRTTKKEQYEKFIKLNINLIELITLRYRLIRSANQCELLTKIYKQQLDIMSIDQSHLFLRYVQFEFAQPRNLSTTDNDYDNESSHIADGRLDKITGQQYLLFAAQELDESSIGRISFRQKDQWLTLINDADDAINNLKIALRLQFMHNHFVYTAILQHRIAIICITQQLQTIKVDGRSEQTKTPPTGKRQISSTTKQTDQPNTLLNNVLYENARRKIFRDNYFISIQFEKTPCRDRILNEFLRKRELKPLQYQQPREVEKLKRSLLNDFIDRVHQRNTLILIRLQIIQSYLSLTYLINQFPLTSRTHFIWSKPIPPPLPTTTVTSSSSNDQNDSATSSPVSTNTLTMNGYQYRPKMMVNENGTDLANLWYIPSFIEQLTMFKNAKLNIDELQQRLRNVLRIVSSLNDLIHIVVAYAQLNNATANADQRFNDRTNDLSTFDQSGEFASELHEIQREIDLSPSLSLSKIADLLETKRRLTIFQIYFSISYLIPNYFLNRKNQLAFNLVYSRSKPILKQFISNYDHLRPIYLILPDPLLPAQSSAKRFYPWTVHEYQYNINSRRLWWPKYTLIDLIHVCLIGLKSSELTLANAELISTHVMLQNIDEVIKQRTAMNNIGTILRQNEIATGDHLWKYLRLEIYIIECIRLELVRNAWSITKLNVLSIDTIRTFDDALSSFRDEIRSPVLRQLATNVGYSNFYNDFPTALITGQLAPIVTEYECKQALISRILIELEGKFMMNDTLKRFKRERTLVLSERLREENSLPTDLWKKQQFTENFSVLRPHILDDFAKLLSHYECKDEQLTLNSTVTTEEAGDIDSTIISSTLSNSPRTSDIYCIRRSDLELCLKEIGNRIMQRERDNYTNYSFYYESLIHNARQLIGLRENEIKSLRSQLQDQQFTIELESHLLTLSTYFDLITELIHLRLINAQLKNDKQLRFDKELNHIRDHFQSINEKLLNTNLLLRTRFEQYREQLYNSTIKIIKEIRTEIYKMAHAKLTSDAKSIIDQQNTEQTKLIHSLQDQIHLNQEKQTNEIYQRECKWHKEQIELEKTIGQLQYDLNRYQKRYIYKTTQQIEEIQTLKKANNYLRKRILTNENHYKKIFETENKSENKANLERDDDLRQALNQKQIIETRLRWMQDQSNQLVLRDHELEKKTNDYERENRAMRLEQTYVKRNLLQTKKKLEQERSLKIDAFQQVEVLRTNLNEIEEELEQVTLNDGAASLVSASIVPPPSRIIASSRSITPYQTILTRNRPMTSIAPYQRDKQRFTNSRLRCYSTTPTKRVQTANVHIEKITPLTEELLSNLGASTTPATSSIRMLRIKSAKT
ncbi:unnamed protein product [Rotaria sordida]|uniref:DUF4549 domain-containing protein n=1 Tax=Rotaria sordida TaxID=392033 RepID=A0A814PU63_9BILA|nr:unnamed protein product [Rotaria sordida]CAF3812049.1 unnamed protein product [Rotaria sordida]